MSLLPVCRNALIGPGPDSPWAVDVAALPLRLHVGISTCVGAGVSKMFPSPKADGTPESFPPSWFVEQVQGMGLPAPEFFATMAIIAEVIGGALLAVGLLTRPAALLVAVHFAVATWMFHGPRYAEGGGGLYPILTISITQLYTWAAVAFIAFGGGRLSLDAVARHIWKPGVRATDA